MDRVIVTGGSGFIGTNLVELFLSKKIEVLNIDISEPRNDRHNNVWRKVDILSEESLINSFQEFKPDVVIHLAARTDLDGCSLSDYRENSTGVTNVIRAIQKTKTIKRCIFASSMLVSKLGSIPVSESHYSPSTLYGESKVQSEKIIRKHMKVSGVEWLIVRPTSIWGPWFSTPYRDFFDAVRKGVYFHPMGVTVLRSYGFVLNTVMQIFNVCSTKLEHLNGKTIYICDYKPISIHDWALSIQKHFTAHKVRTLPVSVMRILAVSGDIARYCGWKRVPLTSFRLNNLMTSAVYDTTPLESVMTSLPYNMDSGVKLTCQWYRDHLL